MDAQAFLEVFEVLIEWSAQRCQAVGIVRFESYVGGQRHHFFFPRDIAGLLIAQVFLSHPFCPEDTSIKLPANLSNV